MRHCTQLTDIQVVAELPRLISLDVGGCVRVGEVLRAIDSIPRCVCVDCSWQLPDLDALPLERLAMDAMPLVQALPVLPSGLKSLDAHSCWMLMDASTLAKCPTLQARSGVVYCASPPDDTVWGQELDLHGCPMLCGSALPARWHVAQLRAHPRL